MSQRPPGRVPTWSWWNKGRRLETYRLGTAGRYTSWTKTCLLLMSALQQIYLRLCSDQSIYITRSDCSLLLRSSSLLILYQAHSISIIVDGTIPSCGRNGQSMMWESVILSGTGQQKTGRLLRCSAAATHVSCTQTIWGNIFEMHSTVTQSACRV